jgi:uncharacterized protein
VAAPRLPWWIRRRRSILPHHHLLRLSRTGSMRRRPACRSRLRPCWDPRVQLPRRPAAPDPAPGTRAGRPLSVTGPQGPAETLLALQDIDTAITQLLHQRAHLPERAAEATERGAVETARTKMALVAERRQALADAQTGLERSLRELDARATDLAAKLPRTTVVREAEALMAEQRTVRQQVSAIEDEELVLLEEDEALDAEDAVHRTDLAAAEERLARAVEARERAEAVVDAELAERRAEREREAAPLPADLLERYDRLRARHDGVAVARLVGGRCDGCHLLLAQAALERIRNAPPDEVVECEECGRLLAR